MNETKTTFLNFNPQKITPRVHFSMNFKEHSLKVNHIEKTNQIIILSVIDGTWAKE